MNRTRLAVLGIFLVVCLGLAFSPARMPFAVPAILAAWMLLVLPLMPLLHRTRSQPGQVRIQTLTYAIDVTLLTLIYAWVGGGWWMGGAFYAFTIVFASMSAPRRHAIGLAVYASLCFAALLFGQSAGVLPHRPFLESPSLSGNHAFAATTVIITAVTLILLALLPQVFISLVQRSELRHDLLLDAAHDGVWTVDRDGLVEYANPRIAELTGTSVQAMLGRPLFDFAWTEAPRLRESFERCRRGVREAIECSLTAPNRELHALVSFSPIVEQGGEFRGALVMVSDLSERRRAEEALRQSEASSRSFIEHAPFGIYRSTRAGDLMAVNAALVEMLGYESEAALLAQNIVGFYRDPRDREVLAGRVVREGHVAGEELAWVRRDGAALTVRLSGRAVYDAEGAFRYWEGFVEDVTRLRAAEQALHERDEQLRQSQKMEAIGRLAGGIAHDFNNLLTVILAHCQFVLERLGEGDATREDVEEIAKAGTRATALTRQLLAFSRKQLLQPKPLELNEVLQDLEKMLRRLVPAHVELVTTCAPDLGVVRADPSQMEQVLVNLTVNAVDAMPAGGRLTIETSNLQLDRGQSPRHPGVELGRYVVITVSDTGTGMDRETQARVFEPFFTTKEQGKGTGLGLSMVYGIVTQSGGHIQVQSEPGAGTTFRIYLPRVDDAVVPMPQAPAATGGGNETVLLAEDETALRAVVARVLRSGGYQVIEAPTGIEALAASERHDGTIHLLLTDLMMPGMGGRELTERLQRLRPGIAVVLMSGHTNDEEMRRLVAASDAAFLQKPFTSQALLELVRARLDAGAVPQVMQAG